MSIEVENADKIAFQNVANTNTASERVVKALIKYRSVNKNDIDGLTYTFV